MTNKLHFLLSMILLFSLGLTACTSSSKTPTLDPGTNPPLTKIRLPMGYIPNVQYAPFYVAVEKGFYRQAGIEIEFDYSFETDGVTLVGAEELNFAVASGEQILMARSQGLPVVYFLSWWQDFPLAIVSGTDQGITEPSDLSGKNIGIPGLFGASYVALRAILATGGIDESEVVLESIGFNQVESLVSGRNQAVVVYANNEPIQLMSLNYDHNIIRVSDYVKLASNGLITNEKTISENPDLIGRMAMATVRGISYTINHPDEAYEISKTYVDGLENANRLVQYSILEASIEYWKSERIGLSDPDAWKNMHKLLADMGLVGSDLDITQSFTNQFIP